MSHLYTPHFPGDPRELERPGGEKATRADGTTVPVDGTVGYEHGCTFRKRNGTTAADTLYINTGSATSCNFDLIVTSTDGIALTATIAELNQAAAVASSTEIVTTTNVITASESRKTFYLTLAGGFTSTLPAPALGLRFKFVVAVAPTTAYIITTNAGADLMYGMMEERAGTAGVAGAGRDTFNFVANQSKIGDWVEFDSDGTNWYYHGMVDIAAGNTVAQS